LAATFEGAGSGSECQGEAKTLMGQVEKTQAGDMAELAKLMEEHDGKAAELTSIYSSYIDLSRDEGTM